MVEHYKSLGAHMHEIQWYLSKISGGDRYASSGIKQPVSSVINPMTIKKQQKVTLTRTILAEWATLEHPFNQLALLFLQQI